MLPVFQIRDNFKSLAKLNKSNQIKSNNMKSNDNIVTEADARKNRAEKLKNMRRAEKRESRLFDAAFKFWNVKQKHGLAA